MNRHSLPARPYWQAKLERLGFDYHSMDGSYWQETAGYQFSARQIDLLEDATNTLHQMCLQAVTFIIKNDRFAQLGINPTAAQLIEQSWRQRDPSLYGRFDLVYHPLHTPVPKLLEYNADTPTSLFESSVVQWYWLQDNYPDADQFNSIHERLISQWRIIYEQLNKNLASNLRQSSSQTPSPHLSKAWSARFAESPTLPNSPPINLTFTTITDSIEDTVTCRYLQDTAIQAGNSMLGNHGESVVNTQFLDLRSLGVLETSARSAEFVDLNDQPITSVFKLYPWEWLLEEAFAHYLPMSDTIWIEPIWKLLLSNKGLLPILWELFPHHPNLLPSYFADQRQQLSQHSLPHGIIEKPLFSREGANINVLDSHFRPTGLATTGEYGDSHNAAKVYQAMQPLPEFITDDQRSVYPVIGSWIIGHVAAGIGIREDNSLITKDSSHFVPHYFRP